MSIELRCTGCQNLLRVPESAAGKQARCPQCQQVMEVPLVPEAIASSVKPSPEPALVATLPPTDKYQPPDPSNPYAASSFYEEIPASVAKGELTPQRTTFDDVIQTTWKVFQAHIGPLAVVGVFTLAVGIIQAVLGVPPALIAEGFKPVIRITVGLGVQVIGLFFAPIITLGLAIPCLTLLRTGTTVPGDFMKFKHFYGAELQKVAVIFVLLLPFHLANMVLTELMKEAKNGDELLPILGALAILSPATIVVSVFVIVVFALSTCFIVDRGAGAIESLKLSWHFMKGNRWVMFLLLLVFSLAGFLFFCCTIGTGSILLSPFFALMTAVTYLQVTGQRNAISPQALGAPPPGVVKTGLPTGA